MSNHKIRGISRSLVLKACLLASSLVPRAAAWGQCTANELAKLTASDAGPGDAFGVSVAISGDVAVIGAPADDDAGSFSGSAYVYRFDGIGWTEEAKLTASDAAAGDNFGNSASISGDVIVIGAWADDDAGSTSGSAYVYRFNTEMGHWQEEDKLTASDGAPDDLFGVSVSIRGDVALIGAFEDDDAEQNSGSAYVFRFNGTDWIEEAKLTASDADLFDFFGVSVSISGNVLLIGAHESYPPFGLYRAGSAYVYRLNGTEWIEEAKLTASDGEDGDLFGRSVAVRGNLAVIGAYEPGPKFGPGGPGSAYVFRFDPGAPRNWIEEAKLTASDGAVGDYFGYAVSISGDPPSRALIGAFFDDDACVGNPLCDSGSAYVFRFDPGAPGSWIEEAKLTASDGAEDDWFGYAVAISADGVGVTGAHRDDDDGSSSGSAYVLGGLTDCNDNGELDLCDIADGKSTDDNNNGIPDECEPPDCPADLDGDGSVGILDLLSLLASWGTDPGGPPDFDGDGTVGILDLLTLLANWGPCP